MRTLAAIVAVAFAGALAACDRAPDKLTAANPRPQAPLAARATASAGPACPNPPLLDLSEYAFADPTGRFEADTPQRRAVEQHFASAYRKACDAGWFGQDPLVDPGSGHPGTLFLANAPDANTAAIYLDSRDDVPDGEHETVLEYPFIDSARQVRVPTTDELAEAIYCRVHGASAEERDSEGRCLVD